MKTFLIPNDTFTLVVPKNSIDLAFDLVDKTYLMGFFEVDTEEKETETWYFCVISPENLQQIPEGYRHVWTNFPGQSRPEFIYAKTTPQESGAESGMET